MYKGKEFDQAVIDAAMSTKSATAAAAKLGVKYVTYKKHAERLKVFRKNPGGKGIPAERVYDGIDTKDILTGKQPQFQTGPLRRRLIAEGYKKNKCEICGISEWNNNNIVCQLDHINGNRNDHRLENLRILCPNCHSQTVTYRGKNKQRTF